MRLAAVLALALALAGCGGGGREHGTATLWVTRDRGGQVLFAGPVPAGLDGIQAVERKFKVTTRYGGRFLQSINGISGSLVDQRDWFFFVNGIEGDRSATEVTLHPGDVLWWDYRRWSGDAMSVPARRRRLSGAVPAWLPREDERRRCRPRAWRPGSPRRCTAWSTPRRRRATTS